MLTRGSESPILSFGMIADVQYADIEDGYDFRKVNRRYYRGSLDKLKEAVNQWRYRTVPKPAFVLQLGDVIDGKNKPNKSSDKALKAVTDVFDMYDGPVYHVLGNHEFYNFSRKNLLNGALYSGNERFSSPVNGKGYYSAEPLNGLKIICLDCYEISMIGNPVDSENYEKAKEILKMNPNEEKNSSEGLTGMNERFVKYNGGVTEEQLCWLDQELEAAERKQQNVIMIGHCPIYHEACFSSNLCWNGTEILEVMHSHSDAIVCYMAGHDHQGGEAIDEKGITHITQPAVLENNKDADFGTAYLYTDQIRIEGNGRVKNFDLRLRFKIGVQDVPKREHGASTCI